MRNIVILQSFCFNMVPFEIIGIWIDEFSKVIVVLDINFIINIFSYEKLFTSFNLVETIDITELLPKMSFTQVIQIFYKSENNEIIIFLQNGILLKLNVEKKVVDVITFVTDQILCLEISPSLEFIAVATNTFKLYLFNNELELIKSTDLDDNDLSNKTHDNSICKEANISWRGDNQVYNKII